MASPGGFILLAFLFAVVLPIGLWLLIERETKDPPVMDRGEAERQARTDGPGSDYRPPAEKDDDTGRNGWD